MTAHNYSFKVDKKMSGHSKWANIQHRKGRQDAKRSNLWTKLVREIIVAARMGGGEPESNSRLRLALIKARAGNVPKDTIQNAILKGTGQLEGVSYEDVRYEGPLNVYCYSKYLFDQVLRRELGYLRAPVIGLKYFNVYGPHEQHKGRMASVAFHQYFQYRRDHKVKLFEGCLGYANGAQERDFVYVEDVCKVLMHFLDRPVSGVFNCGTGRAQPFNAVSLSVVNTIRESEGLPAYTLEEAVGAGEIEYIPFPEALKGKYQAYTQANLEKLRAAGCDVEFRSVEEGTSDYMKVLLKEYPTVA